MKISTTTLPAIICIVLTLGIVGCGSDFPVKYPKIEKGQTLAEVEAIMGKKPSDGKGIGISEAVRVDEDGNRLDEDGNIIDPETLPKFYHWYDEGTNSTIEIELMDGKVVSKKREGFSD